MLEPQGVQKAKNSTGTGSADAKKRKPTSTLSICVQCGEPFYEDSNRGCRYHSGEFPARTFASVAPLLNRNLGVMEPDYDGDFWADHDEDCHGIIDSNEMREEFPDGFVWTCCDKLGSEPGCQVGQHQSNPENSKKGRHL
jgi:hypothetical protein